MQHHRLSCVDGRDVDVVVAFVAGVGLLLTDDGDVGILLMVQ